MSLLLRNLAVVGVAVCVFVTLGIPAVRHISLHLTLLLLLYSKYGHFEIWIFSF
jgi:hypothetical protein